MEKLIRCKDCCYFQEQGGLCRNPDFVRIRLDGTYKVWDVFRDYEDFCSQAEEGAYEPWEFEFEE